MAFRAKKRKRNTGDGVQTCEDCIWKDKQIETLNQEVARLKQDVNGSQNLIYQKEELLKNEKKAKEDALTRLSALISSRIRDNNPDVCDLSDPNRPTKIAEQMSELYDNEWTDAFDELEQNSKELDTDEKLEQSSKELKTDEELERGSKELKTDEELEQSSKELKTDGKNEHFRINILLDTLMTIYKECMDIAANWYLTVKKTIKYPKEVSGEEESSLPEDFGLPKEMLVEIKQLRKKDAMVTLPTIRKMLSERIPLYRKDMHHGPAMREYIAKCESLCWLAALQDPPLHLDAEVPTDFTRRLYKEYTHAGPHVQFIVWPILRISKDGGILNKGVAQGCTVEPTEMEVNEAETKERHCSVE